MNIELLRTFLEVANCHHFGRAADALHLTQAAVSARIKLLETSVGVPLFDRQKRAVQLTPAGHRLVRYADLIISEWRKARQDVAGGESPQLSIGGSLRLWDVLVQSWLHRVRRANPRLALIVESASATELTRRLLDGVLDMAFMLEPPQLELLQVQAVKEIELILVSTERGSGLTQALDSNYIMVDWGLAHALQHRRLFPDAPEPQSRFSHARMALNYMLNLPGAAYLPRDMVQTHVDSGELYEVRDAPSISRTAYAMFPIRSHEKALISELLDYF